MSPERFFRWSIWSPLLVPVIYLAIVYLAKSVGLQPEVGGVGWILFYSMLIGGVPYVVFAFTLAWLMRKATLRKMQLVSLCAPVLFAVLIFVVVAALSFSDLSVYGATQPLVPALFYAAWSLGVGYVYVGLVYTLFFGLQTVGVISPGGPAA
jgi:hypothetical protein